MKIVSKEIAFPVEGQLIGLFSQRNYIDMLLLCIFRTGCYIILIWKPKDINESWEKQTKTNEQLPRGPVTQNLEKTNKQTSKQANKQTHKHTSTQTTNQTSKQASKQTSKQADKQTHK